MDREVLGESKEDYLEAMLMLKEKNGYIRSVDIAELLGVTKPSVSNAVKSLKEKGYIEVDGSNFITLTEEGMILRKRAEEMVHLMKMAEDEIESFRQYVERAKKKIEDNEKKLETLEPFSTNPNLSYTFIA